MTATGNRERNRYASLGREAAIRNGEGKEKSSVILTILHKRRLELSLLHFHQRRFNIWRKDRKKERQKKKKKKKKEARKQGRKKT